MNRTRGARLICLTAATMLAAAAAQASGAMTVRTFEASVVETNGGAVLRFGLSAVPKGAKVHRAILFVERDPVDATSPEALVPSAVCALKAPHRPGGTPAPSGPPLQAAPPDWDGFDATDPVARSAGGTCDLLVKSLPGWKKAGARLEVAWEGKPQRVPPQVTGLRAVHRAGQTFITWTEPRPLITTEKATWGQIRKKLAEAGDSIHYRIYAHTKPIDAESISSAQLIARVRPLSGYNCNGRNMEYLICQAMIRPDEIGELARNYNGYMYTWGMDSGRMDRYPVERFAVPAGNGKTARLPVGTGLYVHSPREAARTYYAAVACADGVADTAGFSKANALGEPVAETHGPGEPVHQGQGLWGPYFDYPGRRQVYVQWCAPPLAPRPNMYFNWSVLAPVDPEKGKSYPVEMYFHAGNFSYAKPRTKYLRDSIQIAPHDHPFSGWYGFNDAWGTVKSWTDGVVRNHTQKRIIAFLDWVKRAYPADMSRVILPGSDGAACLALNYRDVFAYVMIKGFGGGGKVQGRVLDPKQARLFASAWGPKSHEIKDEKGRADWGWAMLDRLALEDPGTPTPLMTCQGTSWGGKRFYGSGFGTFYTNMQKAGQPVIGGHGWDCKLICPGWYTGLWRGLDITNSTPTMAFANSSRSQMKLQHGNTNWYHQWKDVVDEADRFSVFLFGSGKADVTPRRLQKFKARPGETLRWQTKPVPTRRDTTPPAPQGGTVIAGPHGVFTIPQVEIPDGGATLTVTRGK